MKGDIVESIFYMKRFNYVTNGHEQLLRSHGMQPHSPAELEWSRSSEDSNAHLKLTEHEGKFSAIGTINSKDNHQSFELQGARIVIFHQFLAKLRNLLQVKVFSEDEVSLFDSFTEPGIIKNNDNSKVIININDHNVIIQKVGNNLECFFIGHVGNFSRKLLINTEDFDSCDIRSRLETFSQQFEKWCRLAFYLEREGYINLYTLEEGTEVWMREDEENTYSISVSYTRETGFVFLWNISNDGHDALDRSESSHDAVALLSKCLRDLEAYRKGFS